MKILPDDERRVINDDCYVSFAFSTLAVIKVHLIKTTR